MSNQRKRFRKLHEYSAEQDIRYRGPLSYQGLMALGWLMIVFAAVRLLLSALTASEQDPQLINTIGPFVTVLEYLTGFSVPLMLIAAVADALLSNAIYWGAIRWVRADRGETAVITWKAFEATGLGKEDDYLILIAPLMLLFSYNRVPRWKKLDKVIPAAAIILIVLLFLEAFRLAAGRLLANHPVDLNQLDQWLEMIKFPGS